MIAIITVLNAVVWFLLGFCVLHAGLDLIISEPQGGFLISLSSWLGVCDAVC